MKLKLIFIIAFFLISLTSLQAQIRSTKETKVVLLVNKETNAVSGIALFDVNKAERELPKKHPNTVFYLGVLKGNYVLNNDLIELKSGAVITMYTNKQLFSKDQFLLNKEKNINIGKVKTKIINVKKGEIILKAI